MTHCGALFTYPFAWNDTQHWCANEPHPDTVAHHCICLAVGAPSSFGPHYYDKQGRPLNLCRWAALFEDKENYCRIAETTIGAWWISTVWLGLDHNWGPGPPLIFESMVFWHGPEGGEPDNDRPQYRYSTLAQARRGHAKLVRQYRAAAKKLPLTVRL